MPNYLHPSYQPDTPFGTGPIVDEEEQRRRAMQAPAEPGSTGGKPARLRPTLTLDQVQRRGGVDTRRYDVVSDDAVTTGPLAGRTQGSQQYGTPEEVARAVNLLQKRDELIYDKDVGQLRSVPAGGERNAYAQLQGGRGHVKIMRGGGNNFLLAQQFAQDNARSELAVGYRQALSAGDFDRANRVAEELYKNKYPVDSIRKIQAEAAATREMAPQPPPGSPAELSMLRQGVDVAIQGKDYTKLNQIAAEYDARGLKDVARGLRATANSYQREILGQQRMTAAAAGAKPQYPEVPPENMLGDVGKQIDQVLATGDEAQLRGVLQQLTPSMGPQATKYLRDQVALRKEVKAASPEPPSSVNQEVAEQLATDDPGRFNRAWQIAQRAGDTALMSQIRSEEEQELVRKPGVSRQALEKNVTAALRNLDPRQVFGEGARSQDTVQAAFMVERVAEDLRTQHPDRAAVIDQAMKQFRARVRQIPLELEGESGPAVLTLGRQVMQQVLGRGADETNVTGPSGNVFDFSRPELPNAEGPPSTEFTITVGVDDGFVNIPTIWDGQRHSPEEAVAAFKAGKNPAVGPPYKFKTVDEAVRAAGARSEERGRLGDERRNADPFEQMFGGGR